MKKKHIILIFSFLIAVLLLGACHKHTYTEQTVPPTCTEDGYTEYTCSKCDHTYRDGYVAATGHDNASEFCDAPCNEPTVTVLTCRACGAVTEQKNEQMGSIHDYKTTIVYPDRKNGGYTKHECHNCETSYTENYTDPVDFSVGLAYTRKGNVYYVSGMGSCKDRDVIISPVSEQGYIVAGILTNGLNDYRIQSITVLDGVNDIQSRAFDGCSGVTAISLPAAANVGRSAFGFMPKLTTLSMSMKRPLAYYFEEGSGQYDTHYYVYQSENGTTVAGMIPFSLTKVNVLSQLAPYSFAGCEKIREITLDSNITVLPTYAFSHCNDLSKLHYSDALTAIEEGAFRFCSSLTAFEIPDTVKRMGAYAFEGVPLEKVTLPQSLVFTNNDVCVFRECSKLSEVIFEGNVGVIPPSTFEKCKKLSQIALPDGVTVIGSNAFYKCENLFYFSMPSSLKEIGSGAFSETSLLTVELPDTLKSMGRTAFADCRHLISVNMENTALTKIPEGAFAYCVQLSEIKLPKKLTTIDNYAFEYTDLGKNSIILPETLTYIGGYSLQKVNIEEFCPKNKVYIGAAAFAHSTLKKVVLPEGITVIEPNTFYGCTLLEEVVLPTSLSKIDYSAFEQCTALKSISIPEGVLILGNASFQSCTSLEAVTLPSTLTEIASNAFKDCTSLKEITIPAATHTVQSSAFQGCTSLKKATFLAKRATLGSYLFAQATALETLLLPQEQTSIPPYFCNEATALKSVTIPATVTDIYHHAFWKCTSLETVDFSGASIKLQESCFAGCTALSTAKSAGALLKFDKNNFVDTPLLIEENGLCIVMGRLISVNQSLLPSKVTIPSTVTYINNHVFSYCDMLEEVILPEGVTYIGEAAFANCYNLRCVTFPNTLTSLPNALFSGTNSLEQIVLGSGLEGIHETALPLFGDWFVVIYNGTMEEWRAVEGHNCEAVAKREIRCLDGTIYGVAYKGEFSNVKVTLTTDGVLTFSGSGSANISSTHYFKPLERIKKIVFEEGVEEITGGIHSELFCQMVNVEEVVISSTLKGISPDDFRGTAWYEKIHADAKSVIVVGDRLIMVSNAAAGEFTVPQGVKSIADYAFSGCKELTAIHLPDGLLKIGKNAFSNCEKLVGIQIPNSVSFIGNDAFQKCNAITELIIPSGVKRIGYLATSCLSLKRIEIKGEPQIEYGIASYCPALEVVIIGEGVENLPINTLYECPSLKYVFLPQSLVKIDSSAFWNTPVSAAFLCPDKAVQNLLTKIPGLSYVYSAEAPTVQGLWWRYGEDGSIELYS